MSRVATFDDPEFFGEHWAEIYDEGRDLDPTPAVAFLAGLAQGGRVLELATGTGRVALPLAARGIAVEGIEASEAMAARMRAKPGGDGIPVAIGDMADVAVEGPFWLVYLVYNTLYNLPSAERQAECFRNVARVLDPGGAFVLECFVLDPARYDRGQRVEALSVTESSVVLEVSRHDAAAQRLFKQHLVFDAGGFRGLPGRPPVLLAERARPDGAPGRPRARRAVRRLGQKPVRLGEREPHLGVPAEPEPTHRV